VSHVIWSTLEDVRDWVPLSDDRMPTISERYKVPHFDAKGEANHFFGDAGVPTTLLNTSFYWDNLIYFGMGPKAGDDGVLAITFRSAIRSSRGLPRVTSVVVPTGSSQRERVHRQDGRIAGGHLSGQEMAAGLSKALGKEVRYNAVSPTRTVVRLSRSRGTRQHVPVQRRVLRPVLCRSQP